MAIYTISERCKMTYENFINQPMNIARNPRLINLFNRNKNHPLIRKYSHIQFNT